MRYSAEIKEATCLFCMYARNMKQSGVHHSAALVQSPPSATTVPIQSRVHRPPPQSGFSPESAVRHHSPALVQSPASVRRVDSGPSAEAARQTAHVYLAPPLVTRGGRALSTRPGPAAHAPLTHLACARSEEGGPAVTADARRCGGPDGCDARRAPGRRRRRAGE